jgi:hypothetical protein
MPTPDPFITTQDIVSYVGRGGSADPAMIMAADAACDILRDYTGQQFNRGTATINLDGSGTDAILLPQLPVNAAGTVLVNGVAITDYVLADNGVLFRGAAGVYTNAVWPGGRQNVRVTYDHGWEITDLPKSVKRIALEVAARTVLQGPLMEEYVGTVRTRFAAASTELTPTERLILDGYMRR